MARRCKGSSSRIVEFRRVEVSQLVPPGNQDTAVRQQGGRSAEPSGRHVAGRSERVGHRIKQFGAGRVLLTATSDQHLSIQEQRGRVATTTRRSHITGWEENARGL